MIMRTILALSAAFLLAAPAAAAASPLPVVASTNVYGDIAAQIGGPRVSVTSILSDPNADPHLFEPGTRNALAIATARVVIQNGAGYDDFMTKLERAAPNGKRAVVTVADVLGVHGRDVNPHLWYDVPQLGRIAGAIEAALARADAPHSVAYRTGLRQFVASLGPLRREVARIRSRFHGKGVAYTEPVAGYLLDAAGLNNLAPGSFTRAIANGTEPPPQAVAAMDALIAKHRVRVLLYNSQAVSPITKRVREAAAKARIPVVGVTETLPQHQTFQQWQLAQAHALRRALAP
jgi:zinc/manganese transport system substrate-binding protein